MLDPANAVREGSKIAPPYHKMSIVEQRNLKNHLICHGVSETAVMQELSAFCRTGYLDLEFAKLHCKQVKPSDRFEAKLVVPIVAPIKSLGMFDIMSTLATCHV